MSRSVLRAYMPVLCTSTQYGHALATDTAVATASFASRLAWPPAISGSRSSAQKPARTCGEGECSRTGGMTIFIASTVCPYTVATVPRAAAGGTGVTCFTWRWVVDDRIRWTSMVAPRFRRFRENPSTAENRENGQVSSIAGKKSASSSK
nr:hypothetical protein [Phytohabitans suffuscus]